MPDHTPPRPASVREYVPLAPAKTLSVGGAARYHADVADEATLVSLLAWAEACAISVFVMGGGSNLLVADRGFDGLVIRISSQGIEERKVDGVVHLTVGAGETLDDVVARAVEAG